MEMTNNNLLQFTTGVVIYVIKTIGQQINMNNLGLYRDSVIGHGNSHGIKVW